MLQIKFQASEPSGSEEEDFLIFYYVFLWFELRTPWRGPSRTFGPLYRQTWLRTTRRCFISNFKHPSQAVLKKKIFVYFSMYFYGLNLEPSGAGPSWTLGPSFEQLDKGLLGNAT